MIDYLNPHNVSGTDHPCRQHKVVRAGRRIARRMVVKQHDGRGGRRGRLSEHLARVHDGRVERAHRHDADSDHSVLGVEHDNAELLHRASAVLWKKIGRELTGRGEPRAVRHAAHERPPAQLNGGDDLSGSGWPYSRHLSQAVETDARQAVDATCARDETVRELQGACVAGATAEHEGDQFVVAKAQRAEAFQLLARPILWCDIFRRRYTQTLMVLRFPASACLLAALLASGCAEPPNKEMDQAQGAIDAAQAAGADRYATTEYSAATEALENANTAVAARDHRLALSYALESREHAQNAARGAADAKARVRVEVDHASTKITALVAEGRTQLAAAERAGVPRARLAQPAADLTAAATHLQEAGETVASGDYLGASAALEELRKQVEHALTAIDDAMMVGSPPLD